MSKKQQKALFENTARAMGGAPKKIKLRHIGNCLWPRGGWYPRYPAQRSTHIFGIIQRYRQFTMPPHREPKSHQEEGYI